MVNTLLYYGLDNNCEDKTMQQFKELSRKHLDMLKDDSVALFTWNINDEHVAYTKVGDEDSLSTLLSIIVNDLDTPFKAKVIMNLALSDPELFNIVHKELNT